MFLYVYIFTGATVSILGIFIYTYFRFLQFPVVRNKVADLVSKEQIFSYRGLGRH